MPAQHDSTQRPRPLTVVVVDDEQMIRRALAQTLTGGGLDLVRAVLTQRELEIFERLASGRSNHEIAHELSLSTNTVHNHIASILAKLHLDNRIQAAVQAVRSGIS